MFLGESMCLVPVLIRMLFEWNARRRRQYSAVALDDADAPTFDAPAAGEDVNESPSEEMQGKAVLLFFTPALCDIVGTSLMNVGLLFTPVSIYQMTRGALVLWVGVFSVIFLRRHLFLFQWLCLVMVMLGVSIVGLSGTLLQSSMKGDEGETQPDDDLPPATQALLGVFLILFAQIFTASQFVL
jgi:drug/metabolite transporter (DMT)-like permease